MNRQHFIQFKTQSGHRAAGQAGSQTVFILKGVSTLYELANLAIAEGITLQAKAEALGVAGEDDYGAMVSEKRILSPIDHPDPAHCLVTGTGLTHLGSADARDAMHQKLTSLKEEDLSDSMKMFQMGVQGGKPTNRDAGVQPEWFYKGDGSTVVMPGAELPVPDFAWDGGEEPELVGIYLIGENGLPYRLGFALGNEFSDHKMERENYLWLAHSKLRFCSLGPELLTGPPPQNVTGMSRIIRDGKVLWEKAFLSGENNMSHSFANLEHHHFKYSQFLRPGDLHIHFFGTATLSFSDNIEAKDGDMFEISASCFNKPLSNVYRSVTSGAPAKILSL